MRTLIASCLVVAAGCASAADLVVYDDAQRNGFNGLYSYALGAGAISLTNASPVHTGTRSIAFTARDDSAISFAHDSQVFTQANYVGIRFWVHGGTTGGHALSVNVYDSNVAAKPVATAPLVGYLAQPIAANTWQQVEVRFASAPLSYAGAFARFDLQDGGANDALSPVYVDDIALIDAATPGNPLIFANSFEATTNLPPPANALVVDRDVTDADVGCVGDRFTWFDADGEPRVAVLAHNNGQVCPGGSRGGELRLLKYQTPSGTRTVRASPNLFGGFGYAVSHRGEGGNGIAFDDSPLGHGFTGTFTRVFEGRHHALFRFQQLYPRYSATYVVPPNTTYQVPVTIDWFFSTGRDHPLWSITWDASAVPANALQDDSRAPYGELLFDGAATEGAHSAIAGVAWGDRYKFTTTTAPATWASAWTWNAANTIPYVKLWSTVDATMGTVQTETITQHDAGGYYGANRWNTTSADGSACTIGIGGVDHSMPCDFNWPYQSINYSLGRPAAATNNTRLAWGTNYGFLGQQSYFVHGSAFYGGPLANTSASGWPRQSYATFIVLDRHSIDPVGRVVTQVERVQGTTLTATVGTVATSASAGPNRPDARPLAPTGWDPFTAAWTIDAAANAIDVNLAIAAGVLENPMLVVRNWQGASLPSVVRLNGAALVADVDYFASVIDAQDRLYVTLDRDLVGAANRIEITP